VGVSHLGPLPLLKLLELPLLLLLPLLQLPLCHGLLLDYSLG
jgi:hypothetical protein